MKKLVLVFTCLFYAFVFVPTDVVAEEFAFGSFPIPLMVIDGDNGVFVELTKEIAKQADLSVTIKVNPPLRTQKYFQEGKIIGLFPALDVMFPPGAKIERSDSIYLKQDFVFTKKGNKMLRTLDDLKGLKVGITRGYPYARALREAKDLKIEEVESDELNAKKLIGGRIDAFVFLKPLALDVLSKMSEKEIHCGQEFNMTVGGFYFQLNEEGANLASEFNQQIGIMFRDGTYARIMKGNGSSLLVDSGE